MLRFLFVTAVLVSIAAQAQVKDSPPHIDLEASSFELLQAMAAQPFQSNTVESPEFRQILQVGLKNLDWLIYINKFRKEPLQFTKPGTLRGVPITAPKMYSEEIVVREMKELREKLLPEMTAVLFSDKDLTPNAPEPIETYVELGRQIDRIYQTALRWRMMSQYLDWMAVRRGNDVRGFYFLSRTENLESKLNGFDQLNPQDKLNLRTWLEMQCYNREQDDKICAEGFSTALASKNLSQFNRRYRPNAEENYNSFFKLTNARSDVDWRASAPQTANFFIYDDQTALQKDFLKFNLEDEWKWAGWQLKINFSRTARTHVFWQSGITDHVDRLGGSSIYMNSDAPLTEWDKQWTIRHEFGHVLGFPDCYIEFYDASVKAMVNYQIDIDDLMCSRAGKMNQRLFDDMVNHYKR